MLRHHLVDLRLRVRLQPYVDLLQNTLTLDDDPEHAGFFRGVEDLLEILDVPLEGAAAIHGHEPVAGPEVGAGGRAVFDHRLDDDTGIELFDHRAEVAAAARKLADGLLALAGRRGAHLPILGVGRGYERKRGNEKMRKSDGHCRGRGPWPRSI